MNLTLLLDITVSFGQGMYSINENAGVVQVSLTLSNPSSTVVSINVFNTNVTANGKYIIIVKAYHIAGKFGGESLANLENCV